MGIINPQDWFDLPEEVQRQVEIQIKYEGYIKRQAGDIVRLGKIEKIKIPPGMSYDKINGLSSEIREKLAGVAPLNLGQAARISGVTPAAISILMIGANQPTAM